jgi:hypothetical protein
VIAQKGDKKVSASVLEDKPKIAIAAALEELAS